MIQSVREIRIIGLMVLFMHKACLFNASLRSEIVNLISTSIIDIKNKLEEISQSLSQLHMSSVNVSSKEWVLAFRGTAGVGKSVLAAYKTGDGIPLVVQTGCMQFDSDKPCNSHYRNNDVMNHWGNIYQVALVLYKGRTQVKTTLFDGKDTDIFTWFSQWRVVSSSWTDLRLSSAEIFSIDGDSDGVNERSFLINHSSGDCGRTDSWFVVVDRKLDTCKWSGEDFPVLMYSDSKTYTNWNQGQVELADAFGIYVKF